MISSFRFFSLRNILYVDIDLVVLSLSSVSGTFLGMIFKMKRNPSGLLVTALKYHRKAISFHIYWQSVKSSSILVFHPA